MANRRFSTGPNLRISSDINMTEESYRRNNMSIRLSTTPHNMHHAMRFLVTIATLSMGLFVSEQAFGQGPVTVLPSQSGAGHRRPGYLL